MWRMSTDPQEEGQPPPPVHTPAVRLSMWMSGSGSTLTMQALCPVTSTICLEPQPAIQRSTVWCGASTTSPPATVPGTLTQILTIMFHLCFFIQMNETQHQRWDEGNGGRIIIWKGTAMSHDCGARCPNHYKPLKIAAVVPKRCVIARRYRQRNKPWHVCAGYPAGRSALAQLYLLLTLMRFGDRGQKRLMCDRTGVQLHVIPQNTNTRRIS